MIITKLKLVVWMQQLSTVSIIAGAFSCIIFSAITFSGQNDFYINLIGDVDIFQSIFAIMIVNVKTVAATKLS